MHLLQRLNSLPRFVFLCWESLIRFFPFSPQKKVNAGLVPWQSMDVFFFPGKRKSLQVDNEKLTEKHAHTSVAQKIYTVKLGYYVPSREVKKGTF